jgi:hypothetical protein
MVCGDFTGGRLDLEGWVGSMWGRAVGVLMPGSK